MQEAGSERQGTYVPVCMKRGEHSIHQRRRPYVAHFERIELEDWLCQFLADLGPAREETACTRSIVVEHFPRKKRDEQSVCENRQSSERRGKRREMGRGRGLSRLWKVRF